MNEKLCYSSIIIGIVIIIAYLYLYSNHLLPLFIITYIGIITSILNHGITSEYAKIADRFVMFITSIIYIYYSILIKNKIIKVATIMIIITTLITFFTSKIIRNICCEDEISTIIHMLTHVFALCIFIIICIDNKFDTKNEK